MLEGISYWGRVEELAVLMEICLADFANILEIDGQGMPTNENSAEPRAAWLYQHCTGELPPGESDFERAPWVGLNVLQDRQGGQHVEWNKPPTGTRCANSL